MWAEVTVIGLLTIRRTCCLHLQNTTLTLLSRRPRQSEPPKRRFVTTETHDVTFQKSSSMALCRVFFILRACHLSHPSYPSRTGPLIGICSRLCVRKFPLHDVSAPSYYVISFDTWRPYNPICPRRHFRQICQTSLENSHTP
jgi:hypothetical protein